MDPTTLHRVELVPYLWIERDGKPVRHLASEPMGTLAHMGLLRGFLENLDGIAELAVVMDGKVECYL